MAKFIYVGSGQGVPGLPHEITEQEAKDLGVKQLLDDAVKAGTYKKVAPKAKRGES
jgi:16S rRNA G527 N7-methylase RsmG